MQRGGTDPVAAASATSQGGDQASGASPLKKRKRRLGGLCASSYIVFRN